MRKNRFYPAKFLKYFNLLKSRNIRYYIVMAIDFFNKKSIKYYWMKLKLVSKLNSDVNKAHCELEENWFCMSCKKFFDVPKKDKSRPLKDMRCCRCESEDVHWGYEIVKAKAEGKNSDEVLNKVCGMIERKKEMQKKIDRIRNFENKERIRIPGKNSERELERVIILTAKERYSTINLRNEGNIKELLAKYTDVNVFTFQPREFLNELNYITYRKTEFIKSQRYELAAKWRDSERTMIDEIDKILPDEYRNKDFEIIDNTLVCLYSDKKNKI